MAETMKRLSECRLSKDLHAGGYAAHAVCVECVSGIRWLYKADVDPCHSINLARSVWANRFDLFEFTVVSVVCVNQRTMMANTTISQDS